MLAMQSVDGRITANGVRHVRQAVITGEQVQRADVLAIINELVELRRRTAERVADVYAFPAGGQR